MTEDSRDSTRTRGATFTRQARRAQLIEVTVELVAEKGYAGASLSGIAERAGLTKPAVLYHFGDKAELIEAAYLHVLTALTDDVAAAVEQAPATDGPSAYARVMIEHLRVHPRHTRMLIEALSHQQGERNSAARWRPLAHIIDEARQTRGLGSGGDSRTAALIIGGAIDAVVTEHLHDPDYDTAAATELVLRAIEALLGHPAP